MVESNDNKLAGSVKSKKSQFLVRQFENTMKSVKNVLGRRRKKVGEATMQAKDLAGNTWQYLKTSPSLADAALGRIAQGTKVLAEGGYEKIFRQTFETVPEEQLQDTYACYLSTSSGPVMGVLYVSSAKLAFCSDNPLSYKAGDKTEWSHYKMLYYVLSKMGFLCGCVPFSFIVTNNLFLSYQIFIRSLQDIVYIKHTRILQ
ncbi:unnamed protein product [Fraxinus pennsylvanica]|uniref:GRAM domain-containing protein n=1 Tax=Fraxinus pennsylvanica TaxID=56036 RepID=A0AAD1YV70_9LAMI|nr:unnamed protein product [Fraxinus pennsylvanica]